MNFNDSNSNFLTGVLLIGFAFFAFWFLFTFVIAIVTVSLGAISLHGTEEELLCAVAPFLPG